MEDDYRVAHENVFPDLIAAYSEVGISSMTMYADGRDLFGLIEYEGDFATVVAQLTAHPAAVRWNATYGHLTEDPIPLEEVFRAP
jgi:L-rhamnose mutarotase